MAYTPRGTVLEANVPGGSNVEFCGWNTPTETDATVPYLSLAKTCGGDSGTPLPMEYVEAEQLPGGPDGSLIVRGDVLTIVRAYGGNCTLTFEAMRLSEPELVAMVIAAHGRLTG
jgi:hypothetical protein